MTGSLARFRAGRGSAPARAPDFDDGIDVAYRDVRRFGTWLLLEPAEVEPYLAARLGEEPLGPRFSARGLGERLAGGGRR